MGQYLDFISNHPLLFAALVGVLVMIAITELRRINRGFKAISAQEAVQIMNHEDTLVLDVREDNEVAQGVIGGSKHIPLGLLGKRIEDLSRYKDKAVIAYCRSGNRSGAACGILAKNAFTKIYNLSGGIGAWQAAKLPVSKK